MDPFNQFPRKVCSPPPIPLLIICLPPPLSPPFRMLDWGGRGGRRLGNTAPALCLSNSKDPKISKGGLKDAWEEGWGCRMRELGIRKRGKKGVVLVCGCTCKGGCERGCGEMIYHATHTNHPPDPSNIAPPNPKRNLNPINALSSSFSILVSNCKKSGCKESPFRQSPKSPIINH